MRFIGVDLAWGSGSATKAANETGLVTLEADGVVLDAGWAGGGDAVVTWIEDHATADSLVCVDAPLVVTNERGQRRCEIEVGRLYGRWKVAANSTNKRSPRLAGVSLRETLESRGWKYDDGLGGPSSEGRLVMEVYPYTTLVGRRSSATTSSAPATRDVRGTCAWVIGGPHELEIVTN